jgi:hypothetical protein
MGEYTGDVFFLDEFAIRQWDDPSYSGTRIEGDKHAFVNEIHRQHSQVAFTHYPAMISSLRRKPLLALTSSCLHYIFISCVQA